MLVYGQMFCDNRHDWLVVALIWCDPGEGVKKLNKLVNLSSVRSILLSDSVFRRSLGSCQVGSHHLLTKKSTDLHHTPRNRSYKSRNRAHIHTFQRIPSKNLGAYF